MRMYREMSKSMLKVEIVCLQFKNNLKNVKRLLQEVGEGEEECKRSSNRLILKSIKI